MSPPKVKLADLLGKKAETKVEQKVEKKEEKVVLMDKLKTKEYEIQMKEAEIEERERVIAQEKAKVEKAKKTLVSAQSKKKIEKRKYSCPHLVWPYTEELFSRPFLDENRFRLVL